LVRGDEPAGAAQPAVRAAHAGRDRREGARPLPPGGGARRAVVAAGRGARRVCARRRHAGHRRVAGAVPLGARRAGIACRRPRDVPGRLRPRRRLRATGDQPERLRAGRAAAAGAGAARHRDLERHHRAGCAVQGSRGRRRPPHRAQLHAPAAGGAAAHSRALRLGALRDAGNVAVAAAVPPARRLRGDRARQPDHRRAAVPDPGAGRGAGEQRGMTMSRDQGPGARGQGPGARGQEPSWQQAAGGWQWAAGRTGSRAVAGPTFGPAVAICAVLACVLTIVVARAQEDGVLESARVTGEAALVADPAHPMWREAPRVTITRNYLGEPIAGPATEVRSRWTDTDLYLLYICPYETLNLKPDPDTSTETRRLWSWDVAEAFIGSNHDHI